MAPEFLETRRRKEVALARLRELERKVKEGEMVPLGKINAWVAGMIVEARDILQRIGPELADRLAREADPVVCGQLIEKEVHRCLVEMSEHKAVPDATTKT